MDFVYLFIHLLTTQRMQIQEQKKLVLTDAMQELKRKVNRPFSFQFVMKDLAMIAINI